MRVIYNEIGPYAAQWLRNLVDDDHITSGHVDGRDIRDVRPEDVREATQFHAFAGIGVWSYALRLAGWPDDAPVWTGSCPCQPFSVAGKGKGVADERHLWPEWLRLIRECQPLQIFGEQVASPAGRAWFDPVSTDLEALGYAVGAADLCAAGVGAPHIRQRLFFGASWLGDTNSEGNRRHARAVSGLAYAGSERREGVRLHLRGRTQRSSVFEAGRGGEACESDGRAFWSNVDWLPCRDGKTRPVEPGTFPLAHRAPARVERLCAYGNAIVPQVAAAFIRAFSEAYAV